ncbi:hypothetical protein EHS25_004947 [Saitozyma podzolica]|uniref:Anaphase-promoting complex subunit 4-like WD40 domain-containing protein n=1 Tax=Saitozyma podzolica TaxID=1890683 RepID=A0A427Y247_9TREE|nr:hypothetical protein EHS25_004947 [Saitozyma podzolica]
MSHEHEHEPHDDEDHLEEEDIIEVEEEMMRDMENQVVQEDNSWGASALHEPQQSIFTLSLHPSFPNPPLAISGGEDDLAFIFCPIPPVEGPSGVLYPCNTDSFPATKLTGHTDSVVAAGWSFDGEMVATGGMDGRVRVWRRVAGKAPEGDVIGQWKNWEFLTSLETGSEITWLSWHPKGNVLAAGCEDATVWMWQLPSGNTMTVLSSHTLPSSAGVFPAPGRTLLTASLDSSLCLWDPRSSAPLFKSSIFAAPNAMELDPAEAGITALAVAPSGSLAAVGGAAGGVKLVNLPKGDTVGKLEGHGEGESVEALVFVDLLAGAGGGKGVVLVSGGTDGKGFVWDVATGRVRAEIKHDEPITSLAPHPSPQLHLVTSASADGMLKTWDVRTGALVAEHKGHAGVVNGVAVAPGPVGLDGSAGGQVVVSAGDEGVSLIWKL